MNLKPELHESEKQKAMKKMKFIKMVYKNYGNLWSIGVIRF